MTWIDALRQDLKYAARGLLRSPGLVIVAGLSLGVGIGANLTVYSLIREILLKSPSARQPERLHRIETGRGSQMSYLNYRDVRDAGIFEDIAGYTSGTESWVNGETTESIRSYIVTANFFELLGVQAPIGRVFTAAERDTNVALLSHRFWQQRLNADPAVLGSTINLNAKRYTILGILAADHRSLADFGEDPLIYLPASDSTISGLNDRRTARLFTVGRLKPGMNARQAEAALAVATQRLEQLYPDDNKGFARIQRTTPVSGLGKFKRYGPEEWLFSGSLLVVVSVVLLIACANVAGLLLARSTGRRQEIAMRMALGASRSRLIQQLLTESCLLALLSASLGLLLHLWLATPLRNIQTPLFDASELRLSPNGGVLALALAMAAAATLLAGLAPALRSSRAELLASIKEQSSYLAHRTLNLRNLLVAGQVAGATVLLIAGSLFLRSLAHVMSANPGFDTEHTLAVNVNLVRGTANQPAFESIVERIAALPGVQSAAAVAILPVSFSSTGSRLRIAGAEEQPGLGTHLNIVGPRYFETLGIPLLRGRDFTSNDRQGMPQVAIVNQTFARRFFSDADPVGKRAMLGERGEMPVEIIGVVRDSKSISLGEAPDPMMFLSSLQPQMFRRVHDLVVRTAGVPSAAIAPIKQAIAELDRTAEVQVKTMRDHLSVALFPSRAGAILLGSLGALGLLLALVGLYGVMAYAVSRRTKEIGIRMALGASAPSVVRAIVRDGLLLVAGGAIAGLGIAYVLTKPLENFLAAEVGAGDPVSFAAVLVLSLGVGMAASLVPARRAARVDPVTALRNE